MAVALGQPGAIFLLWDSVTVSFSCHLDTNPVPGKQGTSTEELSRSDRPMKQVNLDHIKKGSKPMETNQKAASQPSSAILTSSFCLEFLPRFPQ